MDLRSPITGSPGQCNLTWSIDSDPRNQRRPVLLSPVAVESLACASAEKVLYHTKCADFKKLPVHLCRNLDYFATELTAADGIEIIAKIFLAIHCAHKSPWGWPRPATPRRRSA
jgi:hypothetical protein